MLSRTSAILSAFAISSALGFSTGSLSKSAIGRSPVAGRKCSAGSIVNIGGTTYDCPDPPGGSDTFIVNSSQLVAGTDPCKPCVFTMDVTVSACGCTEPTSLSICFPNIANCYQKCTKQFTITRDIECNSSTTVTATIYSGFTVRSSNSWTANCLDCVAVP